MTGSGGPPTTLLLQVSRVVNPQIKTLPSAHDPCILFASVDEFGLTLNCQLIDCRNSVNQESHFRQRELFATRAMIAVRAMLALALLVMLVGGSLVWPAAASGPSCAMACCAGHAPHAAGSSMHGSCETQLSTNGSAGGEAQHSHHHHAEQQQTSAADSNVPRAFAGAMASAFGSDMDQVPTIDATSSEVVPDNGARSVTIGPANIANSPTVLTKPCQPGCSTTATGFSAPGRSRNTPALAGSHKGQPPLSTKLAIHQYAPTHSRSTRYRRVGPRGPPQFSS
jgi:hypothetical protein